MSLFGHNTVVDNSFYVIVDHILILSEWLLSCCSINGLDGLANVTRLHTKEQKLHLHLESSYHMMVEG